MLEYANIMAINLDISLSAHLCNTNLEHAFDICYIRKLEMYV